MIKLYETNSFLKECKMQVKSSWENNGKYYITVDQSIFFPEEGGQYADTGIVRIVELPKNLENSDCEDAAENVSAGLEVKLIDGQIVDGEVVYAVSSYLPVGCCLEGKLDWDKRFDRMQNHSGEHILTGVIHNKYGFNNVGFHLSDDGFVTLDLDGVLSYEQVIEMEAIANKVIYGDVPITDSYPNAEELKTIDYRSKIEIDGQVRLITVGDEEETIDICACCAPHVKSTGQIGIIKVISVINYKKGIQIAILCGKRALEYINNEHSMMTSLARFLSTAPENVEKIVKSQQDDIISLHAKLSVAVEGKLIDEIVRREALISSGMPYDYEMGLIFTGEDLTAANMKNIFNALADRFKGYIGIFVGNDESGYRYNAGGRGLDARELASAMREKLQAKGGGSPEMIQGRVTATKQCIESFFTECNKCVSD